MLFFVLFYREFFPEKNMFEAKAKKDYGNKAYQASKPSY